MQSQGPDVRYLRFKDGKALAAPSELIPTGDNDHFPASDSSASYFTFLKNMNSLDSIIAYYCDRIRVRIRKLLRKYDVIINKCDSTPVNIAVAK